ncbi:MAG: hypothetical protein JXX14_19825 [Deltaproteobacteria bacterium]|nr:hypothetical protein [Deltaproteobacteria bacterium]
MARILKNRTYVKKWLVPALLVSVALGVGGGSFFGRINTVSCNKSENVCIVKSRGFLYPIGSYELPVDGIRVVDVYRSENEVRSSSGGAKRWSYVDYSIHLEWQTAAPQPGSDMMDIKVHDIFSYRDPVLKAKDDWVSFLNDPAQQELNIEFGTHRTGYFFSSVFTLMLCFFVLSNGIWRIRMRASEKQVWKGLADGTDDKTQINRLGIDIGIYKGIRSGQGRTPTQTIVLYLYDGTQYQVSDHIRLTHPWDTENESKNNSDRFLRRMPKVFIKEMESFIAEATQKFLNAQ